MKTYFRIFVALLILSALGSCTIEPIEVAQEPSGDFDNVIMRAHNFEWAENPPTKTNLSISDTDGAVFSWAEGEIVGIYPDVGTQVRFPIVDGAGANTQTARFTGGGWAVKGAHKYMAYYPFIPDMDLDKTKIPVDYRGQKQHGNSSTAHLGAFDFMAAAGSAPSDGEVSFDFNHMGSLLMLDLTVPKIGEYNQLILSTHGGNPFVTQGTIDITASIPGITATAWSNEFVVNLTNIITTTVNQNVVIYVLIPPVDMSGQRIFVNLRGDHADCETWFDRGNNKPFKPGSAYRPSMGDMVGGDIVKLESGKQFNIDIKSFVNNDNYIYEKTDYRIKSVAIEVGNSAIPDEPHIDVSAPDSPLPIYAYWRSGTGELIIRTPSNKLFTSEDASGLFNCLSELSSISCDGIDLTYTKSVSDMFSGCVSLQDLDLSEWNTSGVTSFSGLFSGCKTLKNLNIGSFNVENAEWLSAMFKGCQSLESLDLSHFKTTDKLQGIAEMFSGCSSLESITFGNNFYTSSVSDCYYTFANCSSLQTLDISMFDLSNCGEFRGMFDGCSNLETITGDVIITNKATDLECMFQGCSSLNSLDVSSWDLSEVTSLRGTFNACQALTSLDVRNWRVGKVETFEYAFYQCINLQNLDVSQWNTSSATTFDRIFHDCYLLNNLDVSSWVTNNARYFTSMFAGCSSLTSIDVSHFNTSNAVNLGGMFQGCSSLQSIDLSSFNTASVNSISGMFSGCSSLSSIDISNFDISHVIDLSYLFHQCSALKSVNFGTFDTHYCESFERMFSESGFEELDLSFFNTSSAKNISSMFDGCSALTKLNISSFDTSHLTGKMGAFFNNCYVLGEIRLNSAFQLIGPYYFATNLARDIASCTIYCSQAFKNDWHSLEGMWGSPDDSKLIWLNCDTSAPLE